MNGFPYVIMAAALLNACKKAARSVDSL